jgi:hypothetical protein
MEILRRRIDPCSVWLASTNSRVDELNLLSFSSTISLTLQQKIAPTHFRCVATYSPNIGNVFPTTTELETLKDLPLNANDRKTSLPAYLDLAIGSRVRCIRNKGTQIEETQTSTTQNESIGSTVIIGNQEWQFKNLDVDRFRNGDEIPQVQSAAEWEQAGRERRPAWSYYENDAENGKIYGKLYNWYAVNDARGLAPEGWHIPTD